MVKKLKLLLIRGFTTEIGMSSREKISEAVGMATRRRRAMTLRRKKSIIKRKGDITKRRFADKTRLTKRSRRGARNIFKRRFAGGKSYAKLSTAQKITVDKRLDKMKGAISKISTRLIPQTRRREIERLRGTKKENLYFDLDLDMLMESDEIEYDGLDMAISDVMAISEDCDDIYSVLETMEEEPDAWVSSKLSVIAAMIDSIRDYLVFHEAEEDDEEDEEDYYNGYDDYYEESEFNAAVKELGKESFTEEELKELKHIFDEYESISEKAEKANIPVEILEEVYHRGLDEYSLDETKTSSQYAFNRVNAFLAGGNTDQDLREALEIGTDKIAATYARQTPGQDPDRITAKYDASDVLKVLNDVNVQRVKKIHEQKVSKVLHKREYESASKEMEQILKSGEMINPEELASQLSKKYHGLNYNQILAMLGKLQESMQIQEVLKPSDPIEKWIRDFISSDDKRFSGKTKEERIEMAKGAYYAAKKQEKK